MSNFDKIRLIQAGERLDGVHPTDDDVLNRPVIDMVNNLEAGQLDIYATKQSIPFVDNTVFAVDVVNEDFVGYDIVTQKFVKSTTNIRPVGVADLTNHIIHISGVKTFVGQVFEPGKKYFLSNINPGEIVPENYAEKSFISVGIATSTTNLLVDFGFADSFFQTAIWGNITGSLTDQLDLKYALNSKASADHLHTNVYEPYNPAIQSHITQTYGNPHMVTKAEVGLGNCDNTSDLNKPISTATQTALNLKEDKSNKGVANGYAALDSTGKVPSTQLPSFVDDVLEYATLTAFPGTGEIGKLYVALDTNKVYRWSGSTYIYITSGAVDSVDGRTGLVTLSDLYAPLSHVGSTGSAHGLVTTSVNGFMSAADKTKLNGIESGATADMTAAEILTAIKTVDGSTSGLDADLLDGQDGSFYSNQNAFSNIAVSGQTTVSADTQTDTLTLVAGTNITITTDAVNDTITIAANDTSVDWTEIQNKPDPTITLAGDATGSVTLTDVGSGTLTVAVVDNSHNHTSANISDATNLNTANMIVKRDASGNFSAGTITASLSGNAATATKLQTARTVSLTGDATGSASFDGSADTSITVVIADDSHNHTSATGTFTVTSATATNDIIAIAPNASTGTRFTGTLTPTELTAARTWTLPDSTGTVALLSSPTITLTGDVTGTGTMTNLGSVSFATTIAANSVALGTDTTGNYVAGLTAGTGIAISGTAGEGWSPTVTNSAPNVTTDISITHNAGTVVVNSSDGLDGTINSATTTLAGVMSSTDKTKLDGIATGAEVNQNSFSNVVVGATTIAADTQTDTLTLVAGTNIILTPDAGTDTITISASTGSGSGFDADTVDGLHAISFVRSDVDDIIAGDLELSNSALAYTSSQGGVEGIRVLQPQGGTYTCNTSSVTGYLKITLPVSWTNTMMLFDIDIYDYAGDTDGESLKLQVGGYTYATTPAWSNVIANIISNGRTDLFYNVRFGHDGTNCAIYIGESSTVWAYPQVSVSNFVGGYSGATVANWADGWVISFTTTLGTITKTKALENVASYALNADLLDGYNSASTGTANTIALRDASGNIYANAFNTALADTTTSPSHVYVETTSDGWLRPQPVANFKTNVINPQVTYETLSANGDIGTGATQVSQGDHTHASLYQPLDATLTSIAGLVTGADNYVYSTASDTFTTGTITTFGRSLVDDADAATARTTLGLGNVATYTVTDSTSASAIGTGTSIPTERDIYYGLPTINGVHTYTSSTNIYPATTTGTAGQVLTSSGGNTPSWVNPTLATLIPSSSFKTSVRAASTAALTLNTATASIDGVTLTSTDRVLIKNQATTSQNGIYTGVTTTTWVRATDADVNTEIASVVVAVDEGTINGGKLFTNVFKATDTLGTTAMPWYEVITSSGGAFTGEIITPLVNINREVNVGSGIAWYNTTFNAWVDYMGPAGTAGQGPNANITPASGSLVTSWAKRSFIENSTGHGWIFESGLNNATTPTVVAEIRSSDGAAKFGGNVQAPTLQSTVATGTAPLTVTSTTAVTNLNADMLDGKHAPSGVIVGDSDTQTLTNKTLTSPKIGTAILDVNGNEIAILTATASAVNEVTLANAPTGNAPTIYASGTDANVSLNFVPKGTGTVNINGVNVVTTTGTQSLTNKTLSTGSVWNGGTIGVAYGGTGATTLTGILKGNGTSAFTAATAGTDYATGPVASGSTTTTTSVSYNGTTAAAGKFDGGTTTPTGTVRLNYGGYFYPTYLNLMGSADTATAATHYFVETGTDGYVRPKTLANVKTEIVTTAAVAAAGGTAMGVVDKTAAYTVVATDRGDIITCSGTFTLTLTAAATLGNGFTVGIVNIGTGDITIDPNLSELIDGLATKILSPGQSCFLTCNGTAWYTLGSSGAGATGAGGDQVFIENDQTITTNYTITTGKNAGTFGPISIADGVTVTVPDGSTWSVV